MDLQEGVPRFVEEHVGGTRLRIQGLGLKVVFVAPEGLGFQVWGLRVGPFQALGTFHVGIVLAQRKDLKGVQALD